MAHGGGSYSQGLARRVAAMMTRGENVPMDAQRAVANIQTDGGSREDLATLQQFMGEGRSGATFVRRFQGTVNATVNSFSKAESYLGVISGGGRSSSAAEAALFGMLNKGLEKAVASPFLRSVATSVTTTVAKNPALGRALLNAAGRGLRLGGAIGTTIYAGFAIGTALVDAAGQQAKLTLDRIGRQKANEMSPRVQRDLYSRAAAASMGQRWLPDAISLRTGVGFLDNVLEAANDRVATNKTEHEERLAKVYEETVVAARTNPSYFGLEPQGFLAKIANRAGVSVNELRSDVIKEELDDYLLTKIMDPIAAGAYADAALRKNDNFTNILHRIAPSFLRERRAELEAEFYGKLAKTAVNRKAELDTLMEKNRKLLQLENPALNVQRKQEMDMLSASINSYRSRHRAWAND